MSAPLTIGELEELQGRIAQLEQTTALLRSALACGCQSLEACDRTAHLAPDRRQR